MSNEDLAGQILALRTLVAGFLADHPRRQEIIGNLEDLKEKMRADAKHDELRTGSHSQLILGIEAVSRDMRSRKGEAESAGHLGRQVAAVGAAWANSRYYSDAERWTPMFWQADGSFRPMFDKLDLTSVIELACGHGRHAAQIATAAGHIIMVDIFEDNLEFCRERLGRHKNIEFLKGDGISYPVPNECVTAIFCYDAMVHFSPDMVRAYLRDTYRVLVPGGKALFHHSNYAAPLDRPYGENPHARNHMTADLFSKFCSEAKLAILETRVINWGSSSDLDAITLIEKPGFAT